MEESEISTEMPESFFSWQLIFNDVVLMKD